MSKLSSPGAAPRPPVSFPAAAAVGSSAWAARRARPAHALTWVALCATAWLAGCGGGGSSVATGPGEGAQASALAPARDGQVLAYVKDKLKARGPSGGMLEGDLLVSAVATSAGTVTSTGTVVQEAGVDEDDLVKTDGTRILTLEPSPEASASKPYARLAVHQRGSDGRTQELGGFSLKAEGDWAWTRGMLYAPQSQRVAVIAETTTNLIGMPTCPDGMMCIAALLPYLPVTPRVDLQVLDIAQPGQITRPLQINFDGQLVGTRQIGQLLVVAASHAPILPYDRLPANAPDADRQAALDKLTVADVMPQISVNGGPRQPMVSETDCWLQASNASTQVAVTTITTIDLSTPDLRRRTRCFVGGTQAMYLSPASLYLATSRYEVQTLNNRQSFAPGTLTDLHKFALAAGDVAYRGSGSVSGHLGWDRERSAYRMSEHNGDLRVLTYTGSTGWFSVADASSLAPSPAQLSVLREGSNGTLQTVATLPNSRRPEAIGKPGEQVYAVRFAGDRGYVVTFRQTDPLYVLDLSNPTDPRTAGALEVPGFSNWLFPLDGGLLFGVGRDADAQGRLLGLKVALFDVRDAAQPRLVDSRSFGAQGSYSALDATPHGLGLRTVGNTVRLTVPMMLTTSNWTSPSQKLQRFEVDTATRSFSVKASIDLGEGWVDMTTARSLLLGEQLHYVRAGKLVTFDW